MSIEDNLLVDAYIRKNKDAIRNDLEEFFGRFPILNDRQEKGS
jgi:ABC-type branched-subunit amino acid transport system ATPase component